MKSHIMSVIHTNNAYSRDNMTTRHIIGTITDITMTVLIEGLQRVMTVTVIVMLGAHHLHDRRRHRIITLVTMIMTMPVHPTMAGQDRGKHRRMIGASLQSGHVVIIPETIILHHICAQNYHLSSTEEM